MKIQDKDLLTCSSIHSIAGYNASKYYNLLYTYMYKYVYMYLYIYIQICQEMS